MNCAAVDERRDMMSVGSPEVQPEELVFGSHGFPVGSHGFSVGNHGFPAEFPARSHELPAGNHDIAAGSHEVAAGTREEGRGNIFFVLQVGRPRRQITCSRCGQQGHNKNNRRCTRWAGN